MSESVPLTITQEADQEHDPIREAMKALRLIEERSDRAERREQAGMQLPAEDIARIDREFLRAQERDRINERSQQIWPIFVSLASGFGFIAVQSSQLAYLVGLFPILLTFLAMHIKNSEDTLKQIRKYLYKQEQAVGYEGYEHFTRAPENRRKSHGGYKKALRGAFCTTQSLAIVGIMLHMEADHIALLTILAVAVIEIVITGQTWYRLSDRKKKRPATPQDAAILETNA